MVFLKVGIQPQTPSSCFASSLLFSLGPKDIPVLARGAGRAIGRATGYIRNAQSKITDYADRAKIQQVKYGGDN